MPVKEKGRPAGGDPIPNDVRQDEPESISQPAKPQAPDDRGESDLEYFTTRPNVSTRTRLPFAGEFPPGVLGPGRAAFVRILIERDFDGQPKRRARRRLRFCDGGRA